MLVYSGVILFVSATAIALYVLTRGVEQLPVRVIRFALTLLLLIGLYRGNNVVRAILLFLFGLAGAEALLSASRAGDILGSVTMGSLAVTYLSFVAVLATSPAVDAFLRHQRLPTHTGDG